MIYGIFCAFDVLQTLQNFLTRKYALSYSPGFDVLQPLQKFVHATMQLLSVKCCGLAPFAPLSTGTYVCLFSEISKCQPPFVPRQNFNFSARISGKVSMIF